MTIEFLGTGAADWHIKKRDQEPDFRRYSSALIDGTILIDPGPHIYDYAECENKPDIFRNVKYVLVTHSHADHYNAENLLRVFNESNCSLYASKNVHYRALNNDGMNEKLMKIPHYVIGPMSSFELGEYSVVSLPANHSANNPYGEESMHYIIEKDGRSIFYGLDGGWLTCDEWNEICKRRINAFVFDATIGYIRDDWRIGAHNSLYMVELLRDVILRNCAAGDTRFYVSHMARTLHLSRKETEEILADKQIIPAYDGMTVEI